MVILLLAVLLPNISSAQDLILGQDLGIYGNYRGEDTTRIEEVSFVFPGRRGSVEIEFEVFDNDYGAGGEKVEIKINGESVGFAPVTGNNEWSGVNKFVLQDEFVNDNDQNVLTFDNLANPPVESPWAVRGVNFVENIAIITLAWDANTDGTQGYRIHAGKSSRMTSDEAAIDAWCGQWVDEYETCDGATLPAERCKAHLLNLCKDDNDKACNRTLFLYDVFVNVGDVIKFTWSADFERGVEYFFAATAYLGNCESGFSNEVSYTFPFDKTDSIAPATNGKITIRINGKNALIENIKDTLRQ